MKRLVSNTVMVDTSGQLFIGDVNFNASRDLALNFARKAEGPGARFASASL
jgi:hypothetical protein